MRFSTTLLALYALVSATFLQPAFGIESDEDVYAFDDFPLEELLQYPDWFKKSFLELPSDLQEAVDKDKRGIIVYFGQRRCAYCKMLLEVNFGLSDIATYTRRHFDIIPIDIWSTEEVTTLDGEVLTQREYSLHEKTNFTPSLIFYDEQGKEALRLRGYYPPYQFRAALEYVADGHYRNESFPDYLARGDSGTAFEPGDLNEEDFFIPPPHNLDRSRFPGQRPLLVYFEQGNCHACDVLHGQPLRDPAINELLQAFDNVQLDIRDQTPVITPSGDKSNARQWAKALGLFYTPSLIFFDEQGKEIIRVDSVVRFYRLRKVINYITSRGYLTEPNYQRWRVDGGF
ncbi:MAG: thioredoxin fold domain-containing protein [Candidatus Thiodiazotropha sp. (ex Dulcina madagascariensis)]|nr:thioredoxin fold domain-containing protein [Candidatus Thiodiazotropha sp. (ex Dulcina madagascariensis)]MCU7928025.1 thioredoxin fold domain-containing protein [Candidatus Thiodiazotropha sp. (ex Dulcina madagascariensis)]